jgi:hypothetical protein
MLSQQPLWGANAATYKTQVDNAMNYLLSNATVQAVTTRNDGVNICPGGGSCTAVYWDAANNEDTYTTGLIAPAIALYAKNNPGAVATNTGPLAGLTWKQVGQGINNTFAASQSTANQGPSLRGGWRYGLNDGYDSDMSTTQWASVAMTYTATLGATTPGILKTDLANFLAFTQDPVSGAGCYQGAGSGLCDHSDTGGLLLSHSFIGTNVGDPAVQKAIGFLNGHWNEGANGTWYGNFGHPYAMWSVYKGLETTIGLADTTSIAMGAGDCGALSAGVTCNWWQSYNNWLVANQRGDGGWDGYAYWGDTLSTSFNLPILGGTAIPVVPEPSTYAMMLLGLAGIGWLARRSRRA